MPAEDCLNQLTNEKGRILWHSDDDVAEGLHDDALPGGDLPDVGDAELLK